MINDDVAVNGLQTADGSTVYRLGQRLAGCLALLSICQMNRLNPRSSFAARQHYYR